MCLSLLGNLYIFIVGHSEGTVLCLPGMRFSAGYMRASSEGVNCNDLLKKGRTRFITNAAFFYIIHCFLTAAAVRGERDGRPYLILF